MNRISAFLSHLLISIIIVSSVIGLAIFFWYPYPFARIFNLWDALKIVAFVDVVLGPLLTLTVFKPGKPGLKFDLYFIATVQILALSYGVWTTYQSRPVLMTYNDGHINCLTDKHLQESPVNWDNIEKNNWPIPMASFTYEVMDKIQQEKGRLADVFKDSSYLTTFGNDAKEDLEYKALPAGYRDKDYPDHKAVWDQRLGENWKEKPYYFVYANCANSTDLAVIDTDNLTLVDIVPRTNIYNIVRKPNQRLLDKYKKELGIKEEQTPESTQQPQK